MKKNILLICQDLELIKTIRDISQDLGYIFIVASSCKQGEKLCLDYHPDLIFVNCDLLRESSYNFVRKIHSWDKLISIIPISREDDFSLYQKYIHDGASDFIVYPIRKSDLTARIKMHAKIRTLKKQTRHQHQMLSTKKGISASTLDTVRHFFKMQKERKSIADAANEIGMAYQTMHRYVHHLLSAGELEIYQEYGNNGRPMNQYSFRR